MSDEPDQPRYRFRNASKSPVNQPTVPTSASATTLPTIEEEGAGKVSQSQGRGTKKGKEKNKNMNDRHEEEDRVPLDEQDATGAHKTLLKAGISHEPAGKSLEVMLGKSGSDSITGVKAALDEGKQSVGKKEVIFKIFDSHQSGSELFAADLDVFYNPKGSKYSVRALEAVKTLHQEHSPLKDRTGDISRITGPQQTHRIGRTNILVNLEEGDPLPSAIRGSKGSEIAIIADEDDGFTGSLLWDSYVGEERGASIAPSQRATSIAPSQRAPSVAPSQAQVAAHKNRSNGMPDEESGDEKDGVEKALVPSSQNSDDSMMAEHKDINWKTAPSHTQYIAKYLQEKFEVYPPNTVCRSIGDFWDVGRILGQLDDALEETGWREKGNSRDTHAIYKFPTPYPPYPAAAGQIIDNTGDVYALIFQCKATKLRDLRHASVWLPQLPDVFQQPGKAGPNWKPGWDDILEDTYANIRKNPMKRIKDDLAIAQETREEEFKQKMRNHAKESKSDQKRKRKEKEARKEKGKEKDSKKKQKAALSSSDGGSERQAVEQSSNEEDSSESSQEEAVTARPRKMVKK